MVLHEYFSIELTSLFGREVCVCLDRQLDAIQRCISRSWRGSLFLRSCTVCIFWRASSRGVRLDGQYRNRVWLFRPDGSRDYQNKLHMTRFGSERWQLQAGEVIRVLDTSFGKVGVAVCYGSEFPQIARRQYCTAQSGAANY